MKKWWMERVGYQIYPKSFYDSNGDGIGDIEGIRRKIPYLKTLGIDLIWICPFYKSPMDDNGYDISDFFKISSEFGTLKDFKNLIKDLKDNDIKIILDFVLNHTSDEHPWFIESRSSVDNPKRDYYIWENKRVIDGLEYPPTNWASFFGGSAWEKDLKTNQYYMKIFSNKMPDLNWKNSGVRNEMIKVGKWWLDLGVDGFRIDAVSHLQKGEFVDSKYGSYEDTVLDWHKFSNLPNVHKYLIELNKELFSKYDALTIGEAGGEASLESAIKYSSFNSNQLSMVFNFDHNWCNNLHDIDDIKDLQTNLLCLKKAFNKWQTTFKDKGWLPLNWLNHDQPRLISHYGDMNYYKESAKMLATAMYMSRGTPFIYQGEEIGMTNYPFKKLSDFRDISSINSYYSMKDMKDEEKIRKIAKTSRDNPRTPMQWDNTKNAGFTKGVPWININENYLDINVLNNLEDEDSIFHYYKKLISLRKDIKYKEVIIYGSYNQIDLNNKELYLYEREDENYKLLVINSFKDYNINYSLENYKIKDILISNYKDNMINKKMITLRPYESLVIEVEK